MARVVPQLTLLLLLLSINLGVLQNPSLAIDCSAADTIVKERERKIIVKLRFDEVKTNIILFVKPGSDFVGVRLDVQERDGTNHTAWLPAECVPRDGTWRELLVWAGLSENKIPLRFKTGRCRKWCESKTLKHSPITVTIVAYGSSMWIKRYKPMGCNVTKSLKLDPEILPSCQKPPSTKTTAITTTASRTPSTQDKITIIAVSATGLIVMVGVVVFIVVWWKRIFVKLPNSAENVCPRGPPTSTPTAETPMANGMMFRSLPDVPNSHLQFTTDQGHSPDKDDKCFYYEIQPDLKARGVMESLPTRSQPTISNLHHQSITGQERFLNQHNEYFYYEILPDLTSHRVMVSCPAQDSKEPFYTNFKSKYDKQPRSPLHRNVSTRGSHASPLCHQEPTCVSESHIYATVP